MANETLKSITLKGVTFDVPSGGGGGGATYRLNKYGDQIRLTEDGTVVSTVTDKDTTYSAGTNVNISSANVISAVDTTYTAGAGLSLTGTEFSAKTGYTTSGNNRAVQADANGNLYVTQKDTTYSAGTGLSLSGTTFNHSNSVTAQTTEGLLKVKYDAQGHITGSSAVVKKDITDLGVPAQDTTYTAGSGINIDSSNVISATGGGGGGASYRLTKTGSDIKLTEDGSVVSTVTDDNTTYTAGDNIQISSGNVISATDTKYYDGPGIDILNSGVIRALVNGGDYIKRTYQDDIIMLHVDIRDVSAAETISIPNNAIDNYELYTVPYTGYYIFYGMVQFASNTSGARYVSLVKTADGTQFGGQQRAGASPSGQTFISAFGSLSLTKNEKIGLRVFQNSGSANSATLRIGGCCFVKTGWS